MKRFVYSLLWLIISTTSLSGQPELSTSLQLDWNKGILFLKAAYPVAKLAKNSPYPKARHDAETIVNSRLPSLALKAMQNVLIDSAHTLDDYYQEHTVIRQKVNNYLLTAALVNSAFTPDLATIGLEYAFSLWGEEGLYALFVDHMQPFPLNYRLGYTSSTAFSGIVLYAKGEYEMYGKQGTAQAAPALFPGIYDEEMNPVLTKEMCYPEALKKWGLAAVTDKTELALYEQRIGTYPCKIMIRKVFGVYNADLIISATDAALLLASRENQELLRQGRILIIYDQPVS